MSSTLKIPIVHAHFDRARALPHIIRYFKRLDPNVVLGEKNHLTWRVDGRYVTCSLIKPQGNSLIVVIRRADLKPWLFTANARLDAPGSPLSLVKLQVATAAWRQRIFPEAQTWKLVKHVFGDSKDNLQYRWFTEGATPEPLSAGLPLELQIRIDLTKGNLDAVYFVWQDQKDYLKRPIEPSFVLPPLENNLNRVAP